MKPIYAAFIALALTACTKECPEELDADLRYTNLFDIEVKHNQHRRIDINHDNIEDLSFTTLLVGDPLYKMDKLQFHAKPLGRTSLLFNGQDQSIIYDNGSVIPAQTPAGYNWYGAANLLLAEKITIESTPPVYWQGMWKTAAHQFLSFQIRKNSVLYNGWIELSFDTAGEKLILHRAGVSTRPATDLVAGG